MNNRNRFLKVLVAFFAVTVFVFSASTVYANLVLKFDDTISDAVATDSSGNGLNGTCSGDTCPTFSASGGKDGLGAYVFDGINDQISVPNNALLNPTSQGTIAAWVKLSTTGTWHGIIAKGNNNAYNAHIYSIEIDDGNQAHCDISNGNNSVGVPSTTRFVANTYYHLACTYDGTTLKFYVNGVLDGSVAQTIIPQANTSPLSIGTYGGAYDYATATIDDVRVYQNALTQSELQTLVSGSGSGGGGGMLIDVCPNISEAQQSIPVGYTINTEGQCVAVAIDMCPNLLGEQESIPQGYSVDAVGACVFIDVDFCPNIKGIQTTVPAGYTINASGNCVTKTQQDLCPSVDGVQTSYELCKENPLPDACVNIPGSQAIVPIGYTENRGQCFPEAYDVCPNIEGTQIVIPDTYTVGANGDCTFLPPDMCSNLAGYQNEVPRGFKQEGQTCLFQTQNPSGGVNGPNEEDIKTVGFPFIPKTMYIPSDNTFLKNVAKVFNTKDTKTPFYVDAVSAVVGSGGILLGLFLLIRLIRKLIP